MMNMLKRDNGITLVALIITIIIMLILVTASIVAVDIIRRARSQGTMSDMLLIQTKVKMINEKVTFDGDKSVYVGLKLKDQIDGGRLIAKGVITDEELTDDNWYIYDRDTLDSIGLEGIKLKKDEVYLVNYNTAEVRSPNDNEKLPAEGYDLDEKPQPDPKGNIAFAQSPTNLTKGPVSVTITYPTLAGVTKQYKIGNGEWGPYINPLSITNNGTAIYARLINKSGGTSKEYNTTVTNIDNLPPNAFNLGVTVTTNSITVTGNTTDAAATPTSLCTGLDKYQYRIDNGAWTDSGVFSNLVQGSQHTVSMKAIDKVGNEREATNKTLLVTVTPIDSLGVITLTPSTTAWTNGSVAVTITYPTLAGGIKQYKIGAGGTWTTYTAAVSVSSNNTVYARLLDSTGQSSTEKSLNITNIDTVAPTASYTLNPAAGTWGKSTTITVTGSDATSGVASIRKPDGTTVTTTSTTYTVAANGTYSFIITDKAGNPLTYNVSVANVDTLAPTASYTLSPAAGTWGKTVTITVTGADAASGVASIKKPDGTTVAATSTTYTVSANGTYSFVITDRAGNPLSYNVPVSNADAVQPNPFSFTTSVTTSSITVSGSTTDALSGMSKYEYKIDGGLWQNSNVFSGLIQGSGHNIYMRAIDKAGNIRDATNSGEVHYAAADLMPYLASGQIVATANYTTYAASHENGYLYVMVESSTGGAMVARSKSLVDIYYYKTIVFDVETFTVGGAYSPFNAYVGLTGGAWVDWPDAARLIRVGVIGNPGSVPVRRQVTIEGGIAMSGYLAVMLAYVVPPIPGGYAYMRVYSITAYR